MALTWLRLALLRRCRARAIVQRPRVRCAPLWRLLLLPLARPASKPAAVMRVGLG